MLKKLLITCAVFLALSYSMVSAKMILDLTPAASTTITATAANGGTFIVQNNEVQPTGTGVIQPFLTIQQNGQERGYNTDATPAPLDTKRSGGGFTSAIQLGQLGVVQINNVEYIQFLLDVNQQANGNISLNQIQIFTSPTDVGGAGVPIEATQGTGTNGTGGNDSTISFAGATEVFRMNNPQNTLGDLSTNKEIQIDSNHGSGSGDMFLYVQSSLFGTNLNSYVILYSQFGHPNGTYDSNSGFEEWAVRQGNGPTLVPEPATISMILSVLAPLGVVGLRRLRRRTGPVSA